MEKSLDTKLEKIRRGLYKPADFIIADAKDADMGGGIFCTGAQLEVEEGVFENSPVSPAVRYNDATDIWGPRHSVYQQHPSRSF